MQWALRDLLDRDLGVACTVPAQRVFGAAEEAGRFGDGTTPALLLTGGTLVFTGSAIEETGTGGENLLSRIALVSSFSRVGEPVPMLVSGSVSSLSLGGLEEPLNILFSNPPCDEKLRRLLPASLIVGLPGRECQDRKAALVVDRRSGGSGIVEIR